MTSKRASEIPEGPESLQYSGSNKKEGLTRATCFLSLENTRQAKLTYEGNSIDIGSCYDGCDGMAFKIIPFAGDM